MTRPRLDPGSIREVAVLLPDMIGTTICALPAVEAICAAFPRARVQLLGFKRTSEFLRDEQVAAHLHLFDLPGLILDPPGLISQSPDSPLHSPGLISQPPGLISQLESILGRQSAAPVELVFDLLSTRESEAALAGLGIPWRVGWPNDVLSGAGHTVAVPFPGDKQQQSVQDYLDFLEALDLPASFQPPRLVASDPLRDEAKAWLRQQAADQPPLWVLGVGGGNSRKRWPLALFISLAKSLERDRGGQAVFFMGPNEEHLASELRAQQPDTVVALSLPLDLAKGIISQARLAVCNDHALMHMAAALGVPTVGVFLASNPAEWFPYDRPSRFVMGPSLDCRPCYSEDCEGWECNHPSLLAQVHQAVAAALK